MALNNQIHPLKSFYCVIRLVIKGIKINENWNSSPLLNDLECLGFYGRAGGFIGRVVRQ